VFLARLSNYGHSWKNHFKINKLVNSKRSNCRILSLLCWVLTSKSCIPSSRGIYKIMTFKHQSFFCFFGSYLIVKIFTPKFMKIKCYLGIFTTFCSGLLNQIDHTQHNSYPWIQNYEWVIIILMEEVGLKPKLEHYGTQQKIG
jgi:hypothetical protein